MSNRIIDINDDNFKDEVLNYHSYVLLVCWAEWCGPCKIFISTLNEIFNDFSNKIKFVKINIGFSNIIENYNIYSVPTILLFKNGILISSKSGNLDKKKLVDFLKSNSIN